MIFVPFAVHLYLKLDGRDEQGSTYKNDFYFFKRIAQILKDRKIRKITINSVTKAAQSIVDDKEYVDRDPLSSNTVNLYDRQVKAFAMGIYGEKLG